MGRISLKIGKTVFFENETYEIVTSPNVSNVVARNIRTGDIKIIPIERINIDQGQGKNEVNPNKYFDLVDETNWEKAKFKFEIIKPLLEGGRPTKEAIRQRAKECEVDTTTIYRWIKAYKASGGELSSLVPNYSRRGGIGKSRLSEPANLIIQQAIEDIYKTSQRFNIRDVHDKVRFVCIKTGITPPSISTVTRRIRGMSKRELMKARHGRSKSDAVYGQVKGSFEAKRPLDVIQIDHTPLDIELVDDTHRRPIGRPFLTIGIDVYSRMIYSFYISLEHPSFYSVGQCLLRGILQKDKFLERIGVKGEWNIWGIPGSVHLDNAKEFRGMSLKRFCEEYRLIIIYRPLKTPKYGGHVERIIQTVNKEVHKLPGTKFSNVVEKGGYDSEGKAIMTLGEIEKWLAQLIVNVYHKEIHSQLHMTPEKKYEIGILGDDVTPGAGLPDIITGEDAERLRMSLLPSVERTIQRDGVKIKGISYQGDVLRNYVKAKEANGKATKQFVFKVDPTDLSTIYFYDPTINRYFEIHYRQLGFSPISSYERENAKKYLKAKGAKGYNEDDIFSGVQELRRQEEEAAKKTKLVRRKLESEKFNKTNRGDAKKSGSGRSAKVGLAIKAEKDKLYSEEIKPFDVEIIKHITKTGGSSHESRQDPSGKIAARNKRDPKEKRRGKDKPHKGR